MRIQPRQQILDVWTHTLNAVWDERGGWQWGSGDAKNAISDAEQLLCILHPMHEIPSFKFHDPDLTREDVVGALSQFEEPRRIPRVMSDIALEYFDRHSSPGKTVEDRQPLFGGESYLRGPRNEPNIVSPEQTSRVDIVDSYSLSVTLCLSILAFVKDRLPQESVSAQRKKLMTLQRAASIRLTAAMIGLLRSFVVNSVAPRSSEGEAILSMLRQSDVPEKVLLRRVRERFDTLRAQVRGDVRLAVPEETKPEEDQLFEIGWTWGIAADAPEIKLADLDINLNLDIAAKKGLASARPYLYFTVTALDGIVDIQSRRTRALDLLDLPQQRLADALQLRWDLTQQYWSALARFDTDRWPLEDIPWRTSDGEESDYYSLLVVSVLIQDLAARSTATSDAALTKTAAILEELARRGRITRRMMEQDPALLVHKPGVRNRLRGSETLGPELSLFTSDFAPLLIKRSQQAMRLTDNIEIRERLMAVAESAMDHLEERRLAVGRASGLWDDAGRLRPGSEPLESEPSWYLNERVVEALVTTAGGYVEDPPQSARMYEHLIRMLNEADHIYNQELLEAASQDRSALSTGLDEIERLVARARELSTKRVGTAIALAERALRLLDEIALARIDAERG